MAKAVRFGTHILSRVSTYSLHSHKAARLGLSSQQITVPLAPAPAVQLAGHRLLSTDNTDDLKFGGVYTPEDMTPPIPPYIEKQGETVELKRARLLYQSRKRGMLENGLLLSTFAGKYLNSLTEAQLSSYDKLINQPTNDWEIYYWVTEAKETPEEFQSDVMDLLKKHAKNEEKDVRIRQPDLD